MSVPILSLSIVLTAPSGDDVVYGTVPVYAVEGKSGRTASLSPVDGTAVRSLSLPIVKGLPLAMVARFDVSTGKGRKAVAVRAMDGLTGGERPKPKRYGRFAGTVGTEEWTIDVQVSADGRKPEEWSLYLSGRPGAAVAAPTVDLSALSALLAE